jgi:hypothetical protein
MVFSSVAELGIFDAGSLFRIERPIRRRISQRNLLQGNNQIKIFRSLISIGKCIYFGGFFNESWISEPGFFSVKEISQLSHTMSDINSDVSERDSHVGMSGFTGDVK